MHPIKKPPKKASQINNTAKHAYSVTAILTACLLLGSFYNGPSSDLILLTAAWTLVAIFLVMTVCRKKAQLIQLPTDRISLFFMLYMALIFFSGFLSTAPNNTNIVRWAYLLGPALYLLWRRFGSYETWNSLWSCIFGIGVLSALIGIFEFWQNPQLNVSGQREDPNTYADLLLAILTPATMIYLNANLHALSRRSYELGMALIALALILSDSRAGLLIWATSLILLVVYLLINKQLQLKRLAAVMGIFGVAWIVFLQLPATIESYAGLMSTDNAAVNIRMLMWKSSWEMYLQNPFLGSGLGTFGMYYESFRSPQEFVTSGMNPHNDYLQILIEGGPILLAFIFGFGLVALQRFANLLFKKEQGQADFSATQFSLIVVVLGLLAHATINFTITTLILSMIACLYLAIATDSSDSATTSRPIKNLQPKAALAILITSIFLPLSILWLDSIVDNIYNPSSLSHRNIALINQQDADKMYRAANILARLRPRNIYPKNYQLLQADAAFNNSTDQFLQKRLSSNIVNQYQAMKETCQPCDFLYRNLGNHFRQRGKTELANAQYLEAIAIAPTTIQNYLAYADFLAANGEYSSAMRMLLVEINQGMPIIAKRSGENTMTIVLQHALNLAKQFGTTTEINHLNGRLLAMKGQNTPE